METGRGQHLGNEINDTISMCCRVEHGLTPVPKERMGAVCGYCKKRSAHSPLHFITCQAARKAKMWIRHFQVVWLIASYARVAGIPLTVEPKHLQDKSNKRPDIDMFVRLMRKLVDVTIRCSAGKSDPDSAFEAAENEKSRKYAQMARECGADIVTLAFDAFGGWSNQSSKFLDDLRRVRAINPEANEAFKRLKQEISCAIHRANGKALQEASRAFNE